MRKLAIVFVAALLVSGCVTYTQAEKVTALNNYRAAHEFKTFNPTNNYAEFLELAAQVHLEETGNPDPMPSPVDWTDGNQRVAAMDIARQAYQDAKK